MNKLKIILLAVILAYMVCSFADDIKISQITKDVVKLTNQKVDVEIINLYIDSCELIIPLNVDDIIYLSKNNIKSIIIERMIKKGMVSKEIIKNMVERDFKSKYNDSYDFFRNTYLIPRSKPLCRPICKIV